MHHYEHVGKPELARAILARLRDVPLDRVWRTVLEGGLLEARLGELATARRVFNFLMERVPWYAPVYLECARVEERWGRFDLAQQVVERGIAQMPRCGPLWFMTFRLSQRISADLDVPRASAHRALGQGHVSAVSGVHTGTHALCTCQRWYNVDVFSLSLSLSDVMLRVPCRQELAWKVHFELAQAEERLGKYNRARDAYADSIRACPHHLRWKVWLSGARMELLSGDTKRIPIARALLSRALNDVPKKMRCVVHLEQSRMHEFVDDLPAARAVLRAAQAETPLDWKLFYESVMLELRAGRIDAAIAETKAALKMHNDSGRLWAILISAHQKQSHAREPGKHSISTEQWSIFHTAIKNVPKSGEVWCEGARICLNPYTPCYFNLKKAHRFLNFAMHFTPQYGDSFIEYLRLKMIVEGMDETQQQGVPVVSDISSAIGEDPFRYTSVHLQHAQRLCVNANPDFGGAWFNCKREAYWAPVEVLHMAGDMIQRHLVANQQQYTRAILAGWYRKDNAAAVASKAGTDCDNVGMSDVVTAGGHSRVHNSVLTMALSDCDEGTLPTPIVLTPLLPLYMDGEDDDHAGTTTVMSDDVTCSLSILRCTELVESGEMSLLSAACSSAHSHRCNSTTSSAFSTTPAAAPLSGENDEDDMQVQCLPDPRFFNSIHHLYPPIANMSVSERHRAIYAADPITS